MHAPVLPAWLLSADEGYLKSGLCLVFIMLWLAPWSDADTEDITMANWGMGTHWAPATAPTPTPYNWQPISQHAGGHLYGVDSVNTNS